MKSTVVLALIFCLFSAVDLRSQPVNPERSQVAGWKVTSESKLSVEVLDLGKYYLGFDITYQNPNDATEFVRQVRVLRPFFPVRSTVRSDMNFYDSAVTYVTDGAEKSLLKEYLSKSDPILEIRWKQEKDDKRQTIKLDGENEVWFWDSSGTWTYHKNVKIKILMLSEQFRELDGKLITVGIRYSIGDALYRAHEVPHSYIEIAHRAVKGGK